MQTIRKYGGFPWQRSNYNYSNGIIGLHEEVEDFCRYMQPTPTEHAVRIELINRIEHVIQGLWPEALVEIFGSFRLGMYLPNSDIDLVVLGRWDHLPLRSLESALRSSGIALPASLQVDNSAVVPFIRFTDSQTHIKIDISFNKTNGIPSAEHIKKCMDEYPGLRKLILVLKQFLILRNLNRNFDGGISSYKLINMCINFLQMHPRNNVHATTTNLGVLLLEFFEVYGLRFNYSQVGISIWQGGGYMRRGPSASTTSSSFYIDDPLRPGQQVNIATSRIKRVFQGAYRVLSEAVFPQRECEAKHRSGYSILGSIIHITDELIDYRVWLRNKFHHLVVLEHSDSCEAAD